MPGATAPDRDQALVQATVAVLATLPPAARDAALGRAMVAFRDVCQRRGSTGEDAELAAARFAAAVITALEARA